MEIMKQKKKQILELSNEEEEEEKEEEKDASNERVDDSKLVQIKHEVQSINECLVGSESCKSYYFLGRLGSTQSLDFTFLCNKYCGASHQLKGLLIPFYAFIIWT